MWINPDEYRENKKNKRSALSQTASLSSLSMSNFSQSPESMAKKKRRVCDGTLDERGSLRIRLDTSHDHLPEEANEKARCSMHRWLGYETTSQISHCPTCNVNLCVKCYRIFHYTPNLVSMKAQLKQKYAPKNSRKKK